MSRRCLLFLVCLGCALPFLGDVTNARFNVSVDEAATRIHLNELAPEVSLVVANGSKDPLRARVRLELLAPNDKVAAAIERNVELKSGTQKVPFTLPFKTRDLTPDEEDEVLWYRLHYRIAPETAAANASTAEGFISLSEITPDLFELRIIGPKRVSSGKIYAPRVRASHPITHRPLKNVVVKGVININDSDDEISLTSSDITDAEGFADLSFTLPVDSSGDDFEVNIEGTLGLVTVKAEHDVDLYNQPHFLISTDKPLYQPGQTVYTRLLLLGPSKRALGNKDVEFKVTDPENTVVSSSTLKTSRFGIASTEWSIPDSTRLGDYRLEFSTEDDDYSSGATVKVSRYDLPNFRVNVKPDRPYYLPGQNAELEIRADYLFGNPVSKGHVRVVRETERTWDYREQKYETTEGDSYEGDTLADGSFKAHIDLKDDHNKLGDEDYNRFNDLTYAAYFTDPTTNRTEQRRFQIRVTKDAIHIYVIRPRDSYYENLKLPLEFYVSTFYADGTPAPSNLTISLAGSGSEKARPLRQTRTNRYGLVKIDQLRVSSADLANSSLDLEMLARDKDGNIGKHAETLSVSDEPVMQVKTTKTLLAQGEPIEVSITSSESVLSLIVNVSREGNIVHSEPLKLRNGHASLLIPYKPDFKDELTIAAYAESTKDDDDEDLIWGAHTILYPRRRDLRLNLESAAQTYKPGEQAHVKFRAVSPEGRAVESALGVVVTDRAVDERVRTDQEFGSQYASFQNDVLGLIGYGGAIGQITRKSLDEISLAKPVSADLALAAEVILNQGHNFDAEVFGGDDYRTDQADVFKLLIDKQLTPLTQALTNNYASTKTYPRNEASLRHLLTQAGIDFNALHDPWGLMYRTSFLTEWQNDVLLLNCAGADKRFDTEDDFNVSRLTWPYFRNIGEAIDSAVHEYHQRTGNYIRNFETLRDELRKRSVNLETLRDPWNGTYKFAFEVNQSNFQIQVTTVQPNSTIQVSEFTVWSSKIDYFAENRWNIDTTLANRLKETGSFPANENELHGALLPAGIDTSALRDPWSHPYYFVFQSNSFYGDNVTIESRSTYNQASSQQLVIKPVTKKVTSIRIRSAGADGKEGTVDDFEVGSFAATVSEQSATDATPQPVRTIVSFSGSTGAITGTVVDPMEAVISDATITAKSQNSEQVFEATTDENGKYLLRNLPVGIYEVRASRAAFKDSVVSQVVVRSSELVRVNFILEVGTVAEVVTITGGVSESINATQASVSTTVRQSLFLLAPGVAAAKQQLSTPRVREYFPETLLWQPHLTTDKKGRAQLDFKLADNITTWRMSVIGSTEDGEIGTAETEIRAFQPFFAELDPPRILTEGDRISLPVVLRNYLEKRQSVDLTLKPESWFKILDSNQKHTEIPAGDSQNQLFSIQAVASIQDGKQQITALGSDFSDAIEKPVTVHPDGEEKAESISDLLDTTTTLPINLPENTIAKSAHVEVKVYPNLMTHVWESVEGIMKRPYGCGEQTISSTYPSLLVLRYLNREKLDSPLAAKARKYLEAGYQRLLGYQSSSGGFTYWGNGEPDIALTAYAIRFLNDASEVTMINSSASANARRWLLSQQRSDGSWPAYYWDKKEDLTRTAMLTSLVARSLAATETKRSPSQPATENSQLAKALNYLESRTAGFDEPYLIASYSLASALAGEPARVEKANSRLKALAHTEGPRTYWTLETNTPFYGWGLPGRIETTALAIQALASQVNAADEQKRNLQSRGLLFLLQNQDKYGVWYSTQATINVLDAMLSLMSRKTSPSEAGSNSSIEVSINGQPARTVSLPSDTRMIAPQTIDLSSFVKTGNNLIEFRRAGAGSMVSLQVVNTYYIPWNESQDVSRVRSGDAESLKLQTRFDKLESRVTEEITCHVKAERIGFRGYGMLLAEIGLPPGADVDRASLETAIRGSDWSITQYDVLPDRVVVYLWPRAGGSEFSFKFRPRIAMTAKAAPSSIYDYYNPEAKAIVAPGTFVVR